MSSKEDIFTFANLWQNRFRTISDDKIIFYYFSLHLNGSPVYRIIDKVNKENYDIYKIKNKWYISGTFSSWKVYDSSSVENSIAPQVLPPSRGWSKPFFSDLLSNLMNKYYSILALNDYRFDGWVYKYRNKTSKKMKEFFKIVALSINNYRKKKMINFPVELLYIIYNNFTYVQYLNFKN